jgi:hypothetical protein
VIEFIGHLQIATTSNYRALANSCTRLLTTAQRKCSQFVFTSRRLIPDPKNVLCLRPYWLANISVLTKLSMGLPTDGQSASLSSNKAPVWGLRSDLYYSHIGLSFTIAAGPRQSCRLGSEFRGTRDHILLSVVLHEPSTRTA